MKKIKRFSWTFSFSTQRGIHQFIVKDIYVYTAIALSCVLFFSSSFLILSGKRKHSLVADYRVQLQTKDKNIASIERFGKDISLLKTRINSYSEFGDILRQTVDITPLKRNLIVKGIGGPTPLDTLEGILSKSSYTILSDIMKEFNFTGNLVELEQSSYEEVHRKLSSIIDLKRHTPSIWPTHGYVSSGFGWRMHPISRSAEFHSGIDIANLPGTHIYAPADGVVDFSGWLLGFGNYISIDHGYGFKTKYGHLRKILVNEGQKVKRGELVAEMGRTGYVTGPHLHYEVRVLHNPVNPLGYIIRDTLTY